jgi:hypothetical protein
VLAPLFSPLLSAFFLALMPVMPILVPIPAFVLLMFVLFGRGDHGSSDDRDRDGRQEHVHKPHRDLLSSMACGSQACI